jgi:putative peptide zinc metalloprotease protein
VGAVFIHEFGQIAACQSQNLQHGPIGAGIYFFVPVLYADISRVWQLPRERRLMANMGGIHAELCYLGVVFLVGTLMSSATLIYASMIGGTSVIYQLNPFARRDGYWVLRHAAGVPSLLRKA